MKPLTLPPRNWVGRFLDGFGGHRLYLLGALGFLLSCVLWGMGRIDTTAWCMAVGTIGAFIGGNELTGAVRDKANQPPLTNPASGENT